MPDTILQNTLTGTLVDKPLNAPPSSLVLPTITSNNTQNIKNLSGIQKTPQQLLAFQKMMHMTSTEAYKQRQSQELNSTIGEGGQFNPNQVSGNTFSSIIGNLEQNRGKEVSGISNAISAATGKVQDEATKRLNYLQDLENKKITAKKNLEDDLKVAKLKTGSKAKKAAKAAANHAYEAFMRDYTTGIQQAGSDNSYLDFSVPQITQSIQDLKDRNYSYEQIHGALNDQGIPIFPGSVAVDYLNTIFQ